MLHLIPLLGKVGRASYHAASRLKEVRDLSRGDVTGIVRRHLKARLVRLFTR